MNKESHQRAAQRLFRAVLCQAIQDSKETGTFVVEVTEETPHGTFRAVCYAPTVEEAVRQAKIEICGQRPRFRGSPLYTVRAAKLNQEAEDFVMTERSDAFVMAQGVSDVNAFRSGMRQRMAATVVTVNVESRSSVTFRQQDETEKQAA
jgi:hypothetical protein